MTQKHARGRNWDLWPKPYRPRAFGGKVVQLSWDYRKCVAFIGTGEDADFKPFGTAFFLRYEDVVYLVTAQHVVAPLGDNPFTIRVNKKDGSGPLDVPYDPLDGQKNLPWFVSEDASVDVAILQAGNWRRIGAESLFVDAEHLLTEEKFREENIGIGAFCYAIGLFRLMSGKRRSLPIVHTGHIAMLPGDERIPVENWRHKLDPKQDRSVDFEGYLVEMASIDGLSGSPVFARPAIHTPSDGWDQGRPSRDILIAESQLYLIGLWRSAWGGDPDQILEADRGDHKVPVGVGCVEPASKILDLLNSPPVASARAELHARWAAQEASRLD